MAIAGKVAITLSTENGGAWSADVTYDRLVAVKHNNNLYISRKTVANVEPPNDEFWFLALEGFGGDDVQALIDRLNELSDLVQAIIDGTTQVGNAKTLDGNEAEYFFPKSGGEIKTDSSARLPQLPLALINGVNENGSVMRYDDKKGTLGHLGFVEKNKPIFSDVNSNVKDLLHTGNKPTGTYTGNGDATKREISIGNAVGNTCMITSDKGMVLLSAYGGIGKKPHDTAVTGIGASGASCLANRIILVTDNELLNASGVTYTYWYL